MAIHKPTVSWDPWDTPITYKETSLQGKLVKGEYHIRDDLQASFDNPDTQRQVKEKLAELIAKDLLKNDLLHFTKQVDPNSGTTVYRVYAYILPNDKVQVIKQANMI
jgi:hypothetical protein